MKTTVSFFDFVGRFKSSDTYKNNFSREGLQALFDYLESLEEDTGEEMHFDMVALCCDFTEYNSAYEAMEQYQPEDMPIEGEEGDDLTEIQEKNEKAAHEWLEDRTTVIDVKGGGVIIQNF